MQSLFDISFAPANFVLTLLLGIVMLYWLVVIFTGFDFDIDGPDAEANASGPDVGNVESPGAWQAILEFFYIGELPVMFLASIVVVSMWFINVNVTFLFGWSHSLLGFLIYIPSFIVSMLITKVVARPFIKLYALFNHKGEAPIDFIGKLGRVTSPLSKERLGQIEVRIDADFLLIYARAMDDEEIGHDETVIILEKSFDGKHYLVQRYNNQ
ncbi:MAG: YqiJ family protein [Schleiferiaceae bacterium]|nr:YqiJ family protein [Schleiferiaceae bacterium]